MKGGFDRVLQKRIRWVLLFFCLALLILAGRLFILQIVQHRTFVKAAARQHQRIGNIFSERGNIFVQDRLGERIPLTQNRIYRTLVAAPREIRDVDRTVKVLASSLHLDEGMLREKLSRSSDPYIILAKDLSAEETEVLAERLPTGIFFEEEKRRLYPHGRLAANLIGFASKEEQVERGRYGLEKQYEGRLAGEQGIFEGAKDGAGFWIALGRRIIRPPRNGADLVLTVDYNIQLKTEQVLKSLQERWKARSALGVVLDPSTGRILATTAAPSFDPNAFFKESDFRIFLNPTVESTYELGSVMKPITMAGALEEGLVGPDSVYEDTGEAHIGGNVIRNSDGKAHQIQTMTQVLEKSLNTGAVHVSRLLGQKRQRAYLERFGFGQPTGVDLPGEVAGNLSNLSSGREIDYATASFGQGIAVTPLQLAAAIGAIANHGTLMKPYAVERIMDDSGNQIVQNPEPIRSVLSTTTAETLTKMLVSTVRNGYENRAGVSGYFVAGKTGTAQVPREDRRGYSDQAIHTFVGYAPAFQPRFLVVLQLNEPQGIRFAASSMTPAFRAIAEFILNYYEVPPDEK